MPTSNENIRDALIRHQVNLQRMGAGLSAEVVRILDLTEASLVEEIERALKRGATVETSAGLRKLEHLEDAVREIRRGAFERGYARLRDVSRDLVRHEAEFAASTVDVHTPVVLDLTLPTAKTLEAIVISDVVEGHVLSEWFDRLSEDDARRILDKVRVGLTRGLSNQDIARSVVGTVDFRGSEGTTNLTRRHIDSITRTAVNQFSNSARELTFRQNSKVIAWEVYTATLDSRTTAICRSLDGTRYPVGKGKFPPQHFRCRSIRVAVVGGDLVGDRPMKPATEKMLVTEYADLHGLKAKARDELPHGTKGDFDAYARKRIRELVGTVPAATTYQDWLSRQSATFQDEVLGKAKGKLFRNGDMTLDKFVQRDGTELTLGQLVKSNAAAFRKAGLDPSKYALED